MKLPKKYAGVTPGPWKQCNAGNCTCKIIWAEGGSDTVATGRPMACVHGEWGDEKDMIYGEIPKEQVEANALLISDAPRLAAAVVSLRAALERSLGAMGYCAQLDDNPSQPVREALAALTSTSEWEA